MSYGPSVNNSLAADSTTLDALRAQAGKGDNRAAVKEAAKQLESLFMRELIKTMRSATMKSGMLDSAQGDLGNDLLDQQLSVSMSGLPGGLSAMIEKQLSGSMGAGPSASTTGATSAATPGTRHRPVAAVAGSASLAQSPASAARRGAGGQDTTPSGFVQRLKGMAAIAEQQSGIPASYMVGQAGHETGWGKHEIMMKDGTPSYNLFGIKADKSWKGKVAEVTTTEYVNGLPQKQVARFRAYGSYAESFKDYASMISNSPRYLQAKAQTATPAAFASGLQRAGYATDPDYANKLSRAINTTLRVQRLQA